MSWIWCFIVKQFYIVVIHLKFSSVLVSNPISDYLLSLLQSPYKVLQMKLTQTELFTFSRDFNNTQYISWK